MGRLTGKSYLPVTEGKDLSGEVTVEADVVVIGSGAGGSVIAYEMAALGKSVIVLEAGSYVPSSKFSEDTFDMSQRTYVDAAGQTNSTGELNILQGSCVGGSTVVNAAACFRTPDFILKGWREKFGLSDFTTEKLAPYFDLVEKRLSVHENKAHEINVSSQKMNAGCEKLGYSTKPLKRNTRDCLLTGFCIEGCATDRKQSMLVTYLPWAAEKKCTIYANTRADELILENGEARGVRATIIDEKTKKKRGTLTAKGKIVVLSAGAIQSPLFLLRNKLANSSGEVGRNFACHPSLYTAAAFSGLQNAWMGATVGSYCDEFELPDKGGFILEAAMGSPVNIANSSAPSIGKTHLDFMGRYRNMVGIVSLIHDKNVGRVYLEEGEKKIDYAIDPADADNYKKCMRESAKIFFAAGATEVFLPTYEPKVLKSPEEIDDMIDDIDVSAASLRATSYHPQGTCRMGVDPKKTVVSPTGETHDVKRLFIADASLFPTSIMVNPQMTVYVLATYISEQIEKKYGKYFS